MNKAKLKFHNVPAGVEFPPEIVAKRAKGQSHGSTYTEASDAAVLNYCADAVNALEARIAALEAKAKPRRRR